MNLSRLPILPLQAIWTLTALFIVYFVFLIADIHQQGIDSPLFLLLGLFFIQPVFAFIFGFITIALCFLIGLPIRLFKSIRSWWARNWWLPVTGFSISVLLLLVSFHPSLTEEVPHLIDGVYENGTMHIPNWNCMVSGWFLMAFCLLHLYPPFYSRGKNGQ